MHIYYFKGVDNIENKFLLICNYIISHKRINNCTTNLHVCDIFILANRVTKQFDSIIIGSLTVSSQTTTNTNRYIILKDSNNKSMQE
jgi:hypothetical protein